MSIIIVDNEIEALASLKGLLTGDNYRNCFLEQISRIPEYNGKQIILPNAEDIITESYDANSNNNTGCYESCLKHIKEKDVPLFLIDLFLHNNEHNQIDQKEYMNYSGYIFAKGLDEYLNERSIVHSISTISLFFRDVSSTTNTEFGRLIYKPFYSCTNQLDSEGRVPMAEYCSDLYNTPPQLNVRSRAQAFCNIVFYRYIKILMEE